MDRASIRPDLLTVQLTNVRDAIQTKQQSLKILDILGNDSLEIKDLAQGIDNEIANLKIEVLDIELELDNRNSSVSYKTCNP